MEYHKIRLPRAVAAIYKATKELNAEYPCRSFTPDGHLVGHLGEVIAAKEFGLKLLPNSYPGHDAKDKQGRYVQIKLTAKRSVSLYNDCARLIVMRIDSPEWASVIYYGDGAPVWTAVSSKKKQKNGQKQVALSVIERIAREQR